MEDEIDILKGEKQDTMDEIQKNKDELERLKKLLQAKKDEIEQWENQMSGLEEQIDNLYDEMEKIEEEIQVKNEIIADLESRLNQLLNKKAPSRPKNQHYIPVKGDEVDEMLAEYINGFGSPVPWTRLSHSNYTYGSKKVNVKYMRQHLVIKVGGGSMMVEEFVANYEDIELAKMNYFNPGHQIKSQQPAELSGLTKQQKVMIARGVSPRGIGANGSPAKDAMKRNSNAMAALSAMKVDK